jgi:hypothetical protein
MALLSQSPTCPSSCPAIAVRRTASLPLAYGRASTFFVHLGKKDVDGRVKPGDDENEGRQFISPTIKPWMAGTCPAMIRINPDHISRTHLLPEAASFQGQTTLV